MMAKMICQMSQPLSVNKLFISQTLAHYQVTDDVVDWSREECLRSERMQPTIHALTELLRSPGW